MTWITAIRSMSTAIPPRSKPLRPAPSMVQLGRRTLFVLGALGFFFMSLWLWWSWTSVRQLQLQRMTVATSFAANHAQSFFDTLEGQLDGLGIQLLQANAIRNPRAAKAILDAFKVRHPELGGATIILPNGAMLTSTALKPGEKLPNVLANPDWRPDFEESLRARGLSINRPQYGYLLKAWLIPLRYAVRDRKGDVQFLLQTSILIEKQQALWANAGLRPGVQIGLIREDGVLLSMWPIPGGKFDPKRVEGKPVMEAVAKSPSSGFFVSASPTWRTGREGVYQRLRSQPVYAYLSVPNSVFLSLWWQQVRAPLFVLLALFAVAGGVYAMIAKRFIQRMQALQHAMAQGVLNRNPTLPTSGVLEIDELCAALADTQARLKASARHRERQLLSAADAGTYTVRLRDGIVLHADDTFLSMLGRSRAEVLFHPWSALFEPSETDGSITGEFTSQELSLRVLRFRHANGGTTWLSLAEYVDDSEGEPLRHGLAINVSEREKLLAKVQLNSDRLRTLWRLATDRDALDPDKIRQMLRIGLEALNAETALIAEVHGDTMDLRYLVDTAMLFHESQAISLAESPCDYVVRFKKSIFIENALVQPEVRQYGSVAALGLRMYSSAPIWVGDSLYGTLVFLSRRQRDRPFGEEDKAFVELLAAWLGKALFERRQRQLLEVMALTDSLTGLPNRRAAETRLATELARAKRANEPFAVVVCDLDRFKLINDHFGHETGDKVLRHVSSIMREALREGDWVARWGGEEFIIFLHRSTPQEAFGAMERLRDEIRARSMPTEHGRLDFTASFGIGVYEGGEADIAQILSEADGCLYEAKRRGRDRVVASETSAKGLLWRAGMLQHALQEKRVRPAYQVMVDLASGDVVADEALARLIEPNGKVLPATDFVEAAEGINLVHEVDKAVAHSALARCCRREPGQDAMIHFINLSPQFLARRDLLDELLNEAKAMEENGVFASPDHKRIVFEITERQLLEDFNTMREDLKHLLEYGFRLALDDFGSGYSSFLYLAELPISFLKIEGWMVRNMQHNDRILSMVKSVVMLAKTLNIVTIAECVEDAKTAEILRDMGVDWAQGFYFGYPALEEPAVASM